MVEIESRKETIIDISSTHYPNMGVSDFIEFKPTGRYRWVSPDRMEVEFEFTSYYKEYVKDYFNFFGFRFKKLRDKEIKLTKTKRLFVPEWAIYITETTVYEPLIVECSR